MRLYNSGACVMAAVARKLSVYVRRILRRPEVRVMSALILAISGNEENDGTVGVLLLENDNYLMF